MASIGLCASGQTDTASTKPARAPSPARSTSARRCETRLFVPSNRSAGDDAKGLTGRSCLALARSEPRSRHSPLKLGRPKDANSRKRLCIKAQLTSDLDPPAIERPLINRCLRGDAAREALSAASVGGSQLLAPGRTSDRGCVEPLERMREAPCRAALLDPRVSGAQVGERS